MQFGPRAIALLSVASLSYTIALATHGHGRWSAGRLVPFVALMALSVLAGRALQVDASPSRVFFVAGRMLSYGVGCWQRG